MKDYSQSELNNAIDEWIVGNNAARNRIILKYKLIDGLSYNEIADRLHSDESFPPSYKLSTRQIQRIITKNTRILFRHI